METFIHILSKITPQTWVFITALILSAVVYYYKIDKRIIFYYARKKKPWALRAVTRLRNEFEEDKIKQKKKRLDKYIKRANRLSKSLNGRRIYVVELNEDFAIMDSRQGRKWLKQNRYNHHVLLSDVAVYYTPETRKTVKN